MENLEELFYKTKSEIISQTDFYNQEQEVLLVRNLNQIEKNLIFDLSRYRLSSRISGNIEDKFSELKSMLSKMNSGEAKKMTEASIQMIQSTIPELEGALEQDEEKEDERNNQFGKIHQKVGQESDENKQAKDYIYIEDCVKNAYKDIQKNISNYIETYGAMSFGLDGRSMENMTEEISDSCKKCTRNMIERHNIHVDTITEVIKKEIDEFQQNIEKGINKKDREETCKLSNAAQFLSDDVQLDANNPFQLSEEDLNKFKKGESKVITNTQKKSEEKRPLSNEEQFL